MKLKINGFDNEIIFNDKNINIMEIKNTKLFSHIIEILNQMVNGYEADEIILIDDNNLEMKVSQNVDILFDLFNIDYNSKKNLKKIYEIITNNINLTDYDILNEKFISIRDSLIQELMSYHLNL